MVPFDGRVNLLRILDAAGNVDYGRLERSSTPQAVTILSPVEGENLGDPVTIDWLGSDPDLPSTDLEYQVA